MSSKVASGPHSQFQIRFETATSSVLLAIVSPETVLQETLLCMFMYTVVYYMYELVHTVLHEVQVYVYVLVR